MKPIRWSLAVCVFVLLAACDRATPPTKPPPPPITTAQAPAQPVDEHAKLKQELAGKRAALVAQHKAMMEKHDFVAASDVLLPYLDTGDVEIKRLYDQSEAALLKSVGSWRYEEDDDKMAGGKIKTASVRSKNDVNFDFPYRGSQRATLELRSHPRYGRDVMLFLEKGQFLCSVGGCRVSVKFGDSPPQLYSAGEPNDHSSTVLFIRGHDQFVAKTKKVDKVLIEAAFFREGNRIFEFDVTGLKWPPGK